jgi:hypothetical protein
MKLDRGKKPRVGKVLLWGGVATSLACWAGMMINFGHLFKLVAILVMLVASICFAVGIRIELRNHKWYKSHYTSIFWGFVLVAILIAIPLGYQEIMVLKENAKIRGFSIIAKTTFKSDKREGSLFWMVLA